MYSFLFRFYILSLLITSSVLCVKAESLIDSSDLYAYEKNYRYRGFVSGSLVFGSGEYPIYREGVNTIHGIQLPHDIFAGIGIGLFLWNDDIYDYINSSYIYSEKYSMPIFADVRGELHNFKGRVFSPYIDIKLGYNFLKMQGVFFSPEIGMHWYFGHKLVGLGFGLGYHLQSASIFKARSRYENSAYNIVYYSAREILSGISLSIAWDF